MSVDYIEPQTESIVLCSQAKVKCYSSVYDKMCDQHATHKMQVVTNFPI